MAPRHRRPARLTPRSRRTLLGLAMVAVLAPVAGVALGSAIGDVRDCEDDVSVTVAAAPEIAPVLKKYATSWSAAHAPSNGVCAAVTVKSADSAAVAAAFVKKAGAELDLGASSVDEVAVPDVWVPESMTWLGLLGGDLNGLLAADEVSSVAESPVGVGIPQSDTPEGPGQSTWSETAVDVADPRSDAASLALAMATDQQPTAEPKVSAKGATIASDSQVRAHNTANPDEEWAFAQLSPQVRPFDYPYISESKLDSDKRQAIDAFRAALIKDTFTASLTEFGMSKAGPYPQPVDPKDVESALEQKWLP